MRLGAKRRIWFKSNRVNRKKTSFLLILLFGTVILTTAALYFFKLVRPLLLDMAKNQSKVIAEQAIHQAVDDLFKNTVYTDFIRLSRLEDGTISVLESDMLSVNRLKAEASLAIQDSIERVQETEISIPLGSLTGCDMLAGMGPRLTVRLVPYGRVIVEFKSRFTETGINQTYLEISLMVKGNINIVMPGGRVSSEIETELPVVQTVILGKIPENYVNIDREGEAYEDDLLNLIG